MLPPNAVKWFEEYGLMDTDDVIVTIEHCSECEKHELLCHHDEERYKKVAEELKTALTTALQLFAVRFAVLIKPYKSERKSAAERAVGPPPPKVQLLAPSPPENSSDIVMFPSLHHLRPIVLVVVVVAGAGHP